MSSPFNIMRIVFLYVVVVLMMNARSCTPYRSGYKCGINYVHHHNVCIYNFLCVPLFLSLLIKFCSDGKKYLLSFLIAFSICELSICLAIFYINRFNFTLKVVALCKFVRLEMGREERGEGC